MLGEKRKRIRNAVNGPTEAVTKEEDPSKIVCTTLPLMWKFKDFSCVFTILFSL